ncbi:PIN domain-containing protein [Saccharothrix hoggarensis]|uniref:PIN domain-containing protein n=1 Tax=Saccharothrix hoggarensis TaxID=913853 RepID=A0ABW3QMK8_9PSEU
MIYLHTTALLRLASGRGGAALSAFPPARSGELAAFSSLTRVEAAGRGTRRRVDRLLEDPRFLEIRVSALILDLVDLVADDGLDTRRAVHLATALSLRPVITAFFSHDRRLNAAALAHGLPPPAPRLAEAPGSHMKHEMRSVLRRVPHNFRFTNRDHPNGL